MKPSAATKSVLIIDDDEDLGDALSGYLTEAGYEIRVFSSGRVGLASANADPPGIILLDWQMPQMSGQQVIAELEARPALAVIPVILMSANIADIPSTTLKGRRHISKPFDMDALISLLAQA